MANCYANLIILKGDRKQIQNAFDILGENFELNNYWEKYDVYNNDNMVVVIRMVVIESFQKSHR